jgi:division protein CdvB (Snf7/Vps24/ESCRT-III family)
MIANSPESRILNENLLTAAELQERLEEIIRRMQKIQRSVRASRQPASRLELMELRDLGGEYARIIEQLTELPDAGQG